MQKILPALCIVICLLGACKKEKQSQPEANDPSQSGITINQISTALVTAGMTVTLSGTNLPAGTNDLQVRFNGVSAPIEFNVGGVIGVKVPVTTSGHIQLITGKLTITGPSFTYVNTPVIKTASPEQVTAGTIVTLTGTNLTNAGTAAQVTINGVIATVKSATATEIKVEVPRTSGGKVLLTVAPNITAIGPDLLYTSPELLSPYQGGDVLLETQGDVDAFATLNKGKILSITGNLTIKGNTITSVASLSVIGSVTGTIDIGFCPALQDAPFLNTLTAAGGFDLNNSGLTTLSFNRLTNFNGKLWLRSLLNLRSVSFPNFNSVTGLYLYYCPALTDVSFLSSLKTVGSIYAYRVGAASLEMDQITSTNKIEISDCSFSSISLRSLTTIAGDLLISQAAELTKVDFSALQSLGDKLQLSSTGLTDLSGFSSLKTAGSLALSSNAELSTLRGIDKLTQLTAGAIAAGTTNLLPNRINGVYISNNPKLTTLAGMESLQTVPIIFIANNSALNDICPLAQRVNILKTWASYTYTYRPSTNSLAMTTASVKTVNLTNNGKYISTDDAMTAISNCK